MKNIKRNDNTITFISDINGEVKFELISNEMVQFETILTLQIGVEYFIESEVIQNDDCVLRYNDKSIKLNPVINILTRVSRKDKFKDCKKSVNNQSYTNINHIVTYETEDVEKFLKGFDDVTLCKVHPLKRLDVYKSFNYNQFFKQSDLDSWDYKIWDNIEETHERAGLGTTRLKSSHFPYEVYLKHAERKVNDGWVMYLDDDDILYDNNVIQLLVNNIINYDEDTIHWFQCFDPSMLGEYHQTDNGLFPRKYILKHLKDDYPPSLHSINSSTFIFHNKYMQYTAWEGWYGDDYRTAASLSEKISKNNIIEYPIVTLINGYGDGN